MNKAVLQAKRKFLSRRTTLEISRCLRIVCISFFVFIVSGLDPILVHAFVPEVSEKQPLLSPEIIIPNNKIEPCSDGQDFTEILHTADLDCISDQVSKITFNHVEVLPATELLDLPLEPGEKKVSQRKVKQASCSQKNKRSKSLINKQQVLSTTPTVTTDTTNTTLVQKYESIAMVGPEAQVRESLVIEDTALDEFLVRSYKDQPLHRLLQANNDNALTVVSGVQDYLSYALNGGLSKVRWQASSRAYVKSLQLGMQSKQNKIIQYPSTLAAYEVLVLLPKIIIQPNSVNQVKSSVMTTGPPAILAELNSFPTMLQPAVRSFSGCIHPEDTLFSANKKNRTDFIQHISAKIPLMYVSGVVQLINVNKLYITG